MNISWIKSRNDGNKFLFLKNMGFPVIEIDDLEKTDNIIENLVENNCKTIFISKQVSAFSQDIVTRYAKKEEIKIFIV